MTVATVVETERIFKSYQVTKQDGTAKESLHCSLRVNRLVKDLSLVDDADEENDVTCSCMGRRPAQIYFMNVTSVVTGLTDISDTWLEHIGDKNISSCRCSHLCAAFASVAAVPTER